MKQAILVLIFLFSGVSLFSMQNPHCEVLEEAALLEAIWHQMLRDPRYRQERIVLARFIWRQKNALELWKELAVLYGGVAQLAAAYRDDSGGENMLNCAVARKQDDVVVWLGSYAYANL